MYNTHAHQYSTLNLLTCHAMCMNMIDAHPMCIQFNSLQMRIKSTSQRASCERAFNLQVSCRMWWWKLFHVWFALQVLIVFKVQSLSGACFHGCGRHCNNCCNNNVPVYYTSKKIQFEANIFKPSEMLNKIIMECTCSLIVSCVDCHSYQWMAQSRNQQWHGIK